MGMSNEHSLYRAVAAPIPALTWNDSVPIFRPKADENAREWKYNFSFVATHQLTPTPIVSMTFSLTHSLSISASGRWWPRKQFTQLNFARPKSGAVKVLRWALYKRPTSHSNDRKMWNQNTIALFRNLAFRIHLCGLHQFG